MMGKVNLNELAGMLAKKHGLDRRKANQFVNSMVSIIQKGLENDRMVKIRGLGTFKIIDVDARESVNVNTGERHLIEGHPKLTFLPDASLKELVNKPFSMFETVVLNDDVSFDDMVTETVGEASPEAREEAAEEEMGASAITEEESQPVTVELAGEPEEPQPLEELPAGEPDEPLPLEEQPAGEPDEPQPLEEPLAGKPEEPLPLERQPAGEEEKEPQPLVEQPAGEEEKEPQPLVEQPAGEEEKSLHIIEKFAEEAKDPLPSMDQPAEEEEKPQPRIKQPFMEEYYIEQLRKSNRRWLLAVVIALAVGFAIGYFIGRHSKAIPVPVITRDNQKVEKATPQEQPSDTTHKQAEEQQVKQEVLEEKKEQVPTAAKATDGEPEWEKYNNMDARLRNGYYYIVGLDRIEKAREDDNSKRIAKRVFGAVEMACYIEVYNGMNGSTVLKAGTDIKVPKIASKKSVRKKLQQQNKQ